MVSSYVNDILKKFKRETRVLFWTLSNSVTMLAIFDGHTLKVTYCISELFQHEQCSADFHYHIFTAYWCVYVLSPCKKYSTHTNYSLSPEWKSRGTISPLHVLQHFAVKVRSPSKAFLKAYSLILYRGRSQKF